MEVPSWRNGVNFRKIGKVPNEHPSYLMCMVNQKEKRFTEIKYLLLLKTKFTLETLKLTSIMMRERAEVAGKPKNMKINPSKHVQIAAVNALCLNWSDNQMSQRFSLQRCAFACQGFGDSRICQHKLS